MHICGKTNPIWGKMIDTGITAISVDNCEDMGELNEKFGDKVCIVGNVDPIGIIMQGTTEGIYEATKECIGKSKSASAGFILASGCDIGIGTTPQKIHDFINGARIFGRF